MFMLSRTLRTTPLAGRTLAPVRQLSESAASRNWVREMLVAQRAVTRRGQPKAKNSGKAEQREESHGGRSRRQAAPSSAADILTTLSQLVLIGSAAGLVYAGMYPEHVAAKLEAYKKGLTERRHRNMLGYMAKERKHSHGNLAAVFDGVDEEGAGRFKQSLMFANAVYHDEAAADARAMLFQAPILRYGIVTGPAGSGKSRLMRTLAHEQPHFAFFSFGLASGAKSIVDALSQELGYDFDDWTERMLQGYFFKTAAAPVPVSQLDKLAFLLDEFEAACWSLKFNPATGRAGKRPVLVLDDLDSLDFNDKELVKATTMLFNAANKWAREDTALVCFTLSDALLDTLVKSKIVRQDVIATAQVYRIGDLSHQQATRFLQDRLGMTSSGTMPKPPSENLMKDIYRIKSIVGTKINDLLRISEELVKKGALTTSTTSSSSQAEGDVEIIHSQLEIVLERELRSAEDNVAHNLSSISEKVGPRKMKKVLEFLDRLSVLNKKDKSINGQEQVRENGWNFSDLEGSGSRIWEEARRNGLDESLRLLREDEILGSNGLFGSDLVRNGYRRYRHLPPIVFNPDVKKSWFWFF
ncbi:hypothetical protein BDR26DRAFT_922507 [Obelidium mucronatum]|nr:hypothetical protein BDR26DRAFT_922507 [Obelidium mucronatum]